MNIVAAMKTILKLMNCKHESCSAFRYTNLGDGAVLEFSPVTRERGTMTKTEARQRGALCTFPNLVRKGRFIGLCLKISKYLVCGQARCGYHTPKQLRTRGRLL